MAETLDSKLRRMAEELLLEQDRQPLSQEELCAVVARVCAAFAEAPETNGEFDAAAKGMASGLFGEAYLDADAGQRESWDAMCESALRSAHAASKKQMIN